MKNFTKVISTVVLLFALLLSSQKAEATHFKGGDIYYQCLGNGVYRLIFTCYYSCESGSSLPYPPSSISFAMSGCPSVPASIPASSTLSSAPDTLPLYCPGVRTTCSYYANGAIPAGTPDGTMFVNYISDTFSIPPGCTVTAEVDQGSRNGAVTNLVGASGYDIDIVASVTTPANGNCQNNPEFAAYPVNVFCTNQNADFSQGAIDLSGDSLVYTLINPRTFGGTPIPFQAGCSATNPLGAPNVYASVFTFNTRTGNINFTPTASGNYVMAIRVDAYHGGVLVSSTMRDIQIVVVPCNTTVNPPPYLVDFFNTNTVTGGLVYDSTNIGVCPGATLQLTLRGTTAGLAALVKDSANFAAIFPGSTYFVTNIGGLHDTATLHLTWIPQNSDSGFHYLYLTLSDTACPKPSKRTYAFTVSVLTGLYAGLNQVYCNGGQPVTIQAHGAVHYTWTDSATGGPPVGVVGYSPDSSAIIVAPPVPNVSVGYVVHGDLIGGCKNYDTVSVKNVPRFTLSSAATDPAICKYTTTTITTTPNPSTVGPFIYAWTPTALVTSPATASTGIAPLITDTWYQVKVTAVGGCTIIDSVQVRISGAAPRISITPSNNNVCPGDTVTLNGIAFAENLVICGLVDTCPDVNILTSQSVGKDTSSATDIETPYSGDYPAARTQYLITARELNAAGLSSGSITDISFYVKQIQSTVPYDSFTVSMGCTTLDSLTGFVNGLQEVAPATQVFPNTGWSPHPFTHFYNWDGYSNIVMQVCYTRTSTSFNNSDYVAYTTSSYFGSTVYDRDFGSGLNGCGLNSFPTVSNVRPIIKVGMCAPDVLTYQWTPSTLLCDTCASTQVIVNADSTYTLTVRDANCVNDSAFTVRINRNIGINAVPDTTLCGLDTVQLNVLLTTAPPPVCLENYFVTSIPYAAIAGVATSVPAASFVDASGFNNTDDGLAGPFNLPFSFPFYCQNYSQVWICSNAWISLLDPQGITTFTAQSFPPNAVNTLPLKEIALSASDHRVTNGVVSYFTSGIAPNRIFVIKYANLQSYSSASQTTSGEIHLHEGTGVIDIMLLSSNYSLNPHTTGLKDTTNIGIAAPGRNNQNFTITTPEGWRFVPQNGSSVTTGTTVWTPNVSLSDDSVVNPLASPTAPQTYYVDEYLTINQFTNPTTCHVRDSVRVNVTSFSHTVTASPLLVCPGDTSRLTFTSSNPISTYLWTPAASLSDPSVSNPLATVYDTTKFIVNVVDANGCRGVDSVTVNAIATPHPHISPSTTLCFTDSVQLSVNGTYSSYQWFRLDPLSPSGRDTLSTGSTIYAHPPGKYILRVLASGATCYYFSDTANIDTFPHPQLHVTPSGPLTFCTGGNVVLQTDQGYNSYLWSNGSTGQAIPIQASGSYSYTAIDGNGCKLYSDTAVVVVSDPPVITFGAFPRVICSGASTTATVTTTPAGYPVVWQQGGTQVATGNSFTISTAGTYDVIASVGCPTDSQLVIIAATSPVVSIDSAGPISACGCGIQIPVTASTVPSSPADVYTWSTDGSHSATFNIDSTGTYAVAVSDDNGCTATTSISATITCPQLTTAVAHDTIFPSDTIQVLSAYPVGGTVLTAYQWTPTAYVQSPTTSSTAATAQGPGIDSFYVTVTDNNGCTNTKLVTFVVIEPGDFRMPTAFTPNGDGKNEKFYPVLGPNSTSRVVAFKVYNRWGQLLFSDPSPLTAGWNGSFGGTPQASDTYEYFVTVESPDPKDASKKVQKSVEGNFQLFR